jgi:hypothetical protein
MPSAAVHHSLIPMTDAHLAFLTVGLALMAALFQSYQLGLFGYIATSVRDAARSIFNERRMFFFTREEKPAHPLPSTTS